MDESTKKNQDWDLFKARDQSSPFWLFSSLTMFADHDHSCFAVFFVLMSSIFRCAINSINSPWGGWVFPVLARPNIKAFHICSPPQPISWSFWSREKQQITLRNSTKRQWPIPAIWYCCCWFTSPYCCASSLLLCRARHNNIPTPIRMATTAFCPSELRK